MRVGARLVLAGAALAAAVGIGIGTAPHATAAGKPKLRPPSLLWKSYPLVQRPGAPVARKVASERREATGPKTGQSGSIDHMLLLTAVLAMSLVAGTVVVLRGPSPVRVGGSGRRRAKPRSPTPARRPRPRRPQPRRPQPRRPEAEATPPASPRPPDVDSGPAPGSEAPEDTTALEPLPADVQRVVDDLLAAVRPLPPAGIEQQEIPELELRELIVRKYAAPESAHHGIEREIDAALERIQARQAAEALRRVKDRTVLARSEIRMWRGFVKSQLYASMSGADEAFAVSVTFRLRDLATPGPEALSARSALLADLRQVGWRVVAEGPMWYDRTLELVAPDPGERSAASLTSDDLSPRVVYRVTRKDEEAERGAG